MPLLHGPCLTCVAYFFTLITPVKLHMARATFLSLLSVAVLPHEPLFSIQESMMLLNESFTAPSAQNLPFKSFLKAHKTLLSNHGSISASQSSDPNFQLSTYHNFKDSDRWRSMESSIEQSSEKIKRCLI